MGTLRSSKKVNAKLCTWGEIGPCTSACSTLSVWKAALWKRIWVFFHRGGGSWRAEWETRTVYPEGSGPGQQKDHSSPPSPVESMSRSDLGPAAEYNIEFPELSLGAMALPVTIGYVLTLLNFGCKKGRSTGGKEWKMFTCRLVTTAT